MSRTTAEIGPCVVADEHWFRYEQFGRHMELVLMIVVLGVVAVLALTAVGRDVLRANRERNARAASTHGVERRSDAERK